MKKNKPYRCGLTHGMSPEMERRYYERLNKPRRPKFPLPELRPMQEILRDVFYSGAFAPPSEGSLASTALKYKWLGRDR